MPEDRFGDLGPGASESPSAKEPEPKHSAAERLSELDAKRPETERPSGPPPSARPGSRYAWVVGVAAAIVIVAVAINSLPNTGRGFRGPEPGAALPAFAAPSATGDSDEDANVRQEGPGGTSLEGSIPACDVEAPEVVNLCDLRDKPLVVTLLVPGCEDQLDRVESVSRSFPNVNFVGVISGKSRAEVAEIVAAHDWSFPVAADPDLAVFNLYRAGDCPTTTFAYPGGEVRDTRLGTLEVRELAAEIREVMRAPSGAAG